MTDFGHAVPVTWGKNVAGPRVRRLWYLGLVGLFLHGVADPLVTYEPGASDATERLQAIDNDQATGAISHATATEIVYKIARLETGDPNQTSPSDDELEVGQRDLRILRGYGVTVDNPSWSTVARIKGAGGISLGDSYAAALAHETEATLVVGADPEFGDLSEILIYAKFETNLPELLSSVI